MNSNQNAYTVTEEILEAFGIEAPSSQIDIDGMAEDMCTADEVSQIRMIGIYLYQALCGDKRCYDVYNLSMFLLTLLPLPEDVPENFRKQRIEFLNKFSVRQIRLILFAVMKMTENKLPDSEVLEFINYWTIRYCDLPRQTTSSPNV